MKTPTSTIFIALLQIICLNAFSQITFLDDQLSIYHSDTELSNLDFQKFNTFENENQICYDFPGMTKLSCSIKLKHKNSFVFYDTNEDSELIKVEQFNSNYNLSMILKELELEGKFQIFAKECNCQKGLNDENSNLIIEIIQRDKILKKLTLQSK